MSWGAHAGIGDRFHVYMDRRMRSGGGTGNGSQFLFELEGRLDPGELGARLDALPGPWSRVPLQVLDGSPGVESFFNEHYARAFPRPESPEPLEAVLSLGDERSLLLLRWNHVLMDAPGGDLLVRMLDGEDPERFRLHDSPPSLWKRASRGSWLRALLAVHEHALRFLLGSIPGPAQRGRQPDDPQPRARIALLDAEQTASVDRRAAKLAGPLEANHFVLACALQACAEALELGPRQRLLVPCPLDLRPPAWRGPVFSNYFSSVLLRLRGSALQNTEQAIAAVRRAFRHALARRQEVANLFMMGLARWLPYPLLRLLMEGPTLRDPASLYYSKVELTAGRDGRLLGLPLKSCVIGSSVVRLPGLTVLVSRCAGRLTVAVLGNGFRRDEQLLQRLVELLAGSEAS